MSIVRPQRKPRLLLIDDDPAIAAAIGTRLKSYAVEVFAAYFGTQGIWLAVTENPDVILTDMRMPSGGGDYVVECLKRRTDTRNLPIVVLTGWRDKDRERHMRTLGIDHYLYKPAPFETLLRALSRYIDLPLLGSHPRPGTQR